MFGVTDTIEKVKKLSAQEVRFWLAEIDSSEKRKLDEMMKRNDYPELIRYYEGEQYAKGSTQKHLAILNDYFPNTNALLVEIMYQDPEVIAEPSKPNAEENAPIMKSALQYGMKKTDSLTENKIALFDMLYAGICFVEVDHSAQRLQDTSIQRERNIVDKTIDTVKSALTNDQIEAEEAAKSPDSTDAYSLKEKTYLRRWSPLDCGVDYRADRLKDARFVYKIVRYSQAEFNAKYPDYKDKVRAGSDIPYSTHRDPDHKRTIVTYEIQIKRKDDEMDVFTLAPTFMVEEIDYYRRPYKTNGFNLKVGTLDEYGFLYPISRSKINRGMQDNTNNYATFMMEVAERNIPKRGYNKGKVKLDGLTALNSNVINEAVPVDGGPENIWSIPATAVSSENKELIGIFQKKREELWGISAARLSGKSDAQFMGELDIQEAGFQERRVGIQEGLRKLYREELDTLKDIIVTFWDDEYFFKITGSPKPSWYTPQTDPMTGMVLNPLTDILTADYEIDVDIISALKPNKERRKKELVDYLTWLLSPVMAQYFASQGKTVNIDMIKRTATDFGLNPETLLIDLQPPLQPELQPPLNPAGSMPQGAPQGVPNALL